MKIQGKNVLVTGSNRGIGRALVDALLERGAARVYATGRSLASLEAVGKGDERVVRLELDITSEEQSRRAAERAKDVDVVINNAGVLSSYGVLASQATDMQKD